ncbi:hypothetical protein N9A44_01195 [Gammaproteobacteria bacterium]|nr:hypothetical protein [Gammaproteobacteria bacterium]
MKTKQITIYSIIIFLLILAIVLLPDFIKTEFSSEEKRIKSAISKNISVHYGRWTKDYSFTNTNIRSGEEYYSIETQCPREIGNEVCNTHIGYSVALSSTNLRNIFVSKLLGETQKTIINTQCLYEYDDSSFIGTIETSNEPIPRFQGDEGQGHWLYCNFSENISKKILSKLLNDEVHKITIYALNKDGEKSEKVTMLFKGKYMDHTQSKLMDKIIHHSYIFSKTSDVDIRNNINWFLLKTRPYLFLKKKFAYMRTL